MIGHFFYFLGLIIVLFNLFTFSKFKRIFDLREWMIKFKELTGRNPVSTDYRKEDDKEILTVWSLTIILTSSWLFFGLLTKSWYVYLFLIVMNTLINLVVKSVGEFNNLSFVIYFIRSFVTLFVITFLIMNHFHFHLDIWQLIKSIKLQ